MSNIPHLDTRRPTTAHIDTSRAPTQENLKLLAFLRRSAAGRRAIEANEISAEDEERVLAADAKRARKALARNKQLVLSTRNEI